MSDGPILASEIPAPVVKICQVLEDHGHRAWIVGGCVRDLLRGVPIRHVNDWDIATSALPEEVQKTFRRVIPTGLQHGTVSVLIDHVDYEVTTLRGEGAYTDGRRPDSVHFVKRIEDDLARRDFTVNAIAYDLHQDRVIDPFGGQQDLQKQVIRAVGDAKERFAEDGLRVLRAARFVATLGFELESATSAAIPLSLDTYRKVSHERVRDEWMKTMRAERPSRAFEIMRTHGLLDITYPELASLYGCEQNHWHAYDVWTHTMECLDALDGDPVERVAALLHDVGKPATRELSAQTKDYTFYNHERVGAKMAARWLREFRFSKQEQQRITHLVRHHLVCYDASWSDAAVRRFVRRVGPEGVAPLLRLARADTLAKGRPVDDALALLEELRARVHTVLEAGAAMSTRDLAINGNDLMKHFEIPAGRRIGEVLGTLLERVLEAPELNNRESLLAAAAELIENR